eukprot:TRINITY_DN3467_c0_g1_i10.p1 TRINITY_DN3467_c0_g1~~TRINITY_DN3467_c0_g1_i10.p1  ORF type:complete len:1810 (+),score=333.28 TRINITY_DN3467_c0_g1_i10:841-6270(+)
MGVDTQKVLLCVTHGQHDELIIEWLIEMGYDVVGLIVNVGQGGDLELKSRQLKAKGCSNVFIEDAEAEFITDFVYTAIQAKCTVGVPLSSPCIARVQMKVAQREQISTVAHATVGDTQIHFELVYYALYPKIKVIAPWRDDQFLRYYKAATEADEQTEPTPPPCEIHDSDVQQYLDPSEKRNPPPDTLVIEFKDGIPVRVSSDSETHTNPKDIFAYLNKIGRKHSVGVIDRITDRELSLKEPIIVAAPGHTILATAHADIEGMAMDREVRRLRDMLKPKFTALVKGGCRFSPEMDFITAAINKSQEYIDGIVTVRVYESVVFPLSRESSCSPLESEVNASYSPNDVEGFLKIHSSRLSAHHAILTKHSPKAPTRWPSASLTLSDGTVFEGRAFGQPISVSGEVVFTTGMVGYTESLTDPSYRGQILVLTYPMIGNYGIPPMTTDSYGLVENFESFGGVIHAAGLIVSEYCEEPSHWNAQSSLSRWLKSQNIPAVMMVDTRSLVKVIRENGSTLGKITSNYDVPFTDPNLRSLTSEVSIKKPVTYGTGELTILCIDMGIKLNTIRLFLKHNVTLKIVPWDHDITQEDYDGLFISNGPGDPSLLSPTIENVKWALEGDKPVFGICMGNLIMGLAAGCKSYKLKYGNRGQNQPCVNHKTKKCIITTQNHGYAIDNSTVPPDWEIFFTNANDKSNEGLRHKTKPFFSVQFHPEARCGPNDSEYLFKDYIDSVREYKIEEYIRNRPKKVLVLGAGGITIGQAGEFDYSGSQCIKSLKEEGVETVLINPNIATVQTAEGLADHIYSTPLTVSEVEKVIIKEKPDGILLGFGGQTALNCGLQLQKEKVLKRHGVRVLGTSTRAIEISEDRELFAETLKQINEKLAPSRACSTLEEAVKAADSIGYPVMIRCAFALGGLGSGIVNDKDSLCVVVEKALASSPQVLVERSVKGWKEVEYEVVRDIRDNCITVCNMENFDPMGVHTGESIVVAPSQTLTNDEYHMLRSASINIIRTLGIIGECNVQYGLDPESMEYIVIEVNARLSRSSALASKATGYPLAAVAAKLSLGIELPDVINSVTKGTTACFEPSLDYVVVKVPRWDLSKFNMVSHNIGSVMKSVGEVMAIGRSFQEAFQKAIRMSDTSYSGFDDTADVTEDVEELRTLISAPTPKRVFHIAKALQLGISVSQVHSWSKIDCWFLEKLKDIITLGGYLKDEYHNNLRGISRNTMHELKALGFSDYRIAQLVGKTNEAAVRTYRKQLRVRPFVKQIDTVAGEFPADSNANYLYLTYNASFHDIKVEQKPVLVLGGGVYRIGSSVEFDYCAVMCLRNLTKMGFPTVMINSNPETVSTDYDESCRLYFDEISQERVLDVIDFEEPHGVVVSVGGQTAQNLSNKLHENNVPILGTSPIDIDNAEDRKKFSDLCDKNSINQPEWSSLNDTAAAKKFCKQVGYPVLIRPSYVLSGSAMNVAWLEGDLQKLLEEAASVSKEHPVVISKYHTNSMELDVDVVALNGNILCHAISKHLENAGVHSGDATMVLPSMLPSKVEEQVLETVGRITKMLNVNGPMNTQFLLLPDGQLKVIEANVRCSRSIPFVSKTTGINFCSKIVEVLTKDLPGGISDIALIPKPNLNHLGIKAPMFSFLRLSGADPILGVEMSSTGEVGCYGTDFDEVFMKAMLCSGFKLPKSTIYVSIDTVELRESFAQSVQILSAAGYEVFTDPETFQYFKSKGINTSNTTDIEGLIKSNRVHLVINLRDPTMDWKLRAATPDNVSPGYTLRRMSIDFAVPLITDPQIAIHTSRALSRNLDLDISSYSSYFQ